VLSELASLLPSQRLPATIEPNTIEEDPIKVPSQALMAKMPFWNDDYKRFVKKLVPDLDYREFDGSGHFLFMERPKEFNEALAEFLKKQGMVK
jgi:pimeloyl-ACP methyl ester carboxylesterase